MIFFKIGLFLFFSLYNMKSSNNPRFLEWVFDEQTMKRFGPAAISLFPNLIEKAVKAFKKEGFLFQYFIARLIDGLFVLFWVIEKANKTDVTYPLMVTAVINTIIDTLSAVIKAMFAFCKCPKKRYNTTKAETIGFPKCDKSDQEIEF